MQTKLTKKVIDNTRSPKEYGAILNHTFYVKDYQRSYKWGKAQVVMLLKDLNEFIAQNRKYGNTINKYCLQPLVVKRVEKASYCSRLDEEEKNTTPIDVPQNEEHGIWEVIDGQQRLTTLWLILKVCCESVNKPFVEPFSVYYEQFRSMDQYYMDNAKKAIKEWLDITLTDVDDIIECIKQDILLIWYEVPSAANSVEIFTRLNVGKIPLTDAELFKAMLFSVNAATKQEEWEDAIAHEWNSIEQYLRDEEFWYFIANHNEREETRIDFLLRLYALKLYGEDVNHALGEMREQDELFAFNTISSWLDYNKGFSPQKIWEEIVAIFETLKGWYSDRELYHKIGFLITVGDKTLLTLIKNLVIQSQKNTKSDFKLYVDKNIQEIFKKIDIDALDYHSDAGKIKKVLIYFNLLTVMQTSSGQKFSFKNFKKKSKSTTSPESESEEDGDGEEKDENIAWQLEHIHAQKTDEEIRKIENYEKRVELLNGLKKDLECVGDDESKKLIDEIEAEIIKYSPQITWDADEFLKFYRDIVSEYGAVDMHGIGNLTLLDSNTNQSYHNALYPSKRMTILEKLKKGTFIPPCTCNVFMKAYSKQFANMTSWTEKDAEAYVDEIKRMFKEAKIWE